MVEVEIKHNICFFDLERGDAGGAETSDPSGFLQFSEILESTLSSIEGGRNLRAAAAGPCR